MFKAVASNIKKLIEVKENGVTVDSFTVEFERLTDKQRADLWADIVAEAKSLDGSLKDVDDVTTIKTAISTSLNTSVGRIKSSLKNWSDLIGADDKPIPFSVENTGKLLEWREYRTPIEAAFIEILTGSAKDEAAKN